MSAASVFTAMAAQFHAIAQGEPTGVLLPKGGSPFTLPVIVLRDPLRTRPTDGNKRLEYSTEVQIPMALYPGQPNIGGDKVTIPKRAGDATPTPQTVTRLIGQVGGMWHLGLE